MMTGLAFVTAVVTAFGVVVIGNDVGPVLADVSAARSDVWRPMLVFLCVPIATIVGAVALAAVTGSDRPASAIVTAAAAFGVFVGAGTGRIIWRFLELQTYGEIRGLLDSVAVLLLAGSVFVGGVAGALIGDRLRRTRQARRSSQWSGIVATALITYPTMELIGGRADVGALQLWMLGFMLFALGVAPRIGLVNAEGSTSDRHLPLYAQYDAAARRDQSVAVRLLLGFSAGWMASILVNMSVGSFDGQLTRYVMAWILPVLLVAPGVLAHLDEVTGRSVAPLPAPVKESTWR